MTSRLFFFKLGNLTTFKDGRNMAGEEATKEGGGGAWAPVQSGLPAGSRSQTPLTSQVKGKLGCTRRCVYRFGGRSWRLISYRKVGIVGMKRVERI